MLFALPANAATTISFNNGVLKIVGDAADNSFTVGRTPAGVITLNGAQVVGGAATVSNVSVVHLEGGAGNDILRFDETNGPMPKGEFLGGDGRDAFKGGSAADTLLGGAGIDRGTGGPGDDTVNFGADADEFTWNVGDGNDHIDGDAGQDTLIFNGNDDDFESVTLGHYRGGPRFSISRSLAQGGIEEVDASGVELVKANLGGGVDNVGVSNVIGTGVAVVRLDLGPGTDDSAGGGPFFQDVSLFGTNGPDRIRVGGRPTGGVTVSGAGAGGLIKGAHAVDVWGKGGNDIIDAGTLVAGTVRTLREFGAASFGPVESDILIGHPGNDLLRAGRGDDRLEGRGGVDVLEGGGGNDVIIP